MSALALLKTRRFAPLFVVQFGGAMNDNLYKTGMLSLITFGMGSATAGNAALLAAISGMVFILPYFLFSALAGQLADSYDKTRIARAVKLFEIFIMLLGLHAFAMDAPSILWMMLLLFMLGVHSTFFGPVKYSIMPQHLRDDELMHANALIEAGTFLAILLGVALGVLLAPIWAAGLALVIAIAGAAASLMMPPAPSRLQQPVIDLNLFNQTVDLVKTVVGDRTMLLSVIGISWIWALGAVIVGQMQDYTRLYLNGDQNAAILPMMTFSIGIGTGSIAIARLLKGKASPRYAPFAALLLSIFLLDFWFATGAFKMLATSGWVGPFAVLRSEGIWRILFDLFGMAACAGAFIVPLYTLLQQAAPEDQRSRIIAANNVFNAVAMLGFSALAALLLALGVSVLGVFLVLAAINLVFAFLVVGLFPDDVIKLLAKRLLHFLYRVEVEGLEHFDSVPGRAVVVSNHSSYLDGLLLMMFLPGKPSFAINTFIARAWWVKPFIPLFNAFPVDPTNPMATKAMIREVEQEKKLVIFPEGRLTTTGALMKVFEGPGMVADHARAPVIPVRIDGAHLTPFSKLRGKIRLRWFPKIRIIILPPRSFDLPEGLDARERRRRAGYQLSDLMSDMMFETTRADQSLFAALIDARSVHGARHVILEDADRQPRTMRDLLTGALAFAALLAKETKRGEKIGFLLPNASGSVVSFFALQAIGRVPAMLNHGAGVASLQAAVRAADLKIILTSRRFLAAANLGEMVAALEGQCRILYADDLRDRLKPWDKFKAMMALPVIEWLHHRHRIRPDDPAVVLFTSGSEGLPKGVVLSHRNLLANCSQLAARIDFNARDIVFNALPMFHSFGLTGGTLLPVLGGVKTIFYPSPLHYRIVPGLVYDTDATVLFGTDTFLQGYARTAHPYDFYSVRYVIAGAERVKAETRALYADKFGLRILEGYGVTETAPALALNTPMYFRAGTVGRLLPGIEHRIEPVEGISEGGRLLVKGPNVMRGYYFAAEPGVLKPLPEGWHDTGDIVRIDEDGFVTILGRARRFAKLGGEMVSLAAVEAVVEKLWPEHHHAVLAVSDARKGEALLLMTDFSPASADELMRFARAQGMSDLAIPKDIRILQAFPLLASGKADYVRLRQLADNQLPMGN